MEKPWETEAKVMQETGAKGAPYEDIRTIVILRWMYFGDLRPLADAIQSGHDLDRAVLNYLVTMVVEDEELPSHLRDDAPYRLETKRRFGKQGAPKKPEHFARDYLLFKEVARRMKEDGPGNYDAAVKATAKSRGLSERVVRNAYDRYAK